MADLMEEGNDFSLAKAGLLGNGIVPGAPDVVKDLEDLTCLPIDDSEAAALEAVLFEIQQGAQHNPLPTARNVRRKQHCLNLSASAGPSTWTNRLTQIILKRPGGVAALREWIGIWRRCQVAPPTSVLWALGTGAGHCG